MLLVSNKVVKKVANLSRKFKIKNEKPYYFF